MKNAFFWPTALIAALGLTQAAHAASTVDGALDEVATTIVERIQGDGVPTIGISTFTHADGTCSDMSNYINEFIVDSLFNVGNGRVDIIERSQLSAIFREMKLVFDGTIAPDAAKALGEIEGVDALVTGSLVQFGEMIKIQARMISTENGRLFATARSEFPNVGSVANMMATRSRAQCGFAEEGGAANAVTTQMQPKSANTATNSAVSSPTASMVAPSRKFESAAFDAEVTRLVVSEKGDANFVVRFHNKGETPIGLAYIKESLSVVDETGAPLTYKDNWRGIETCYSVTQTNFCTGGDPRYATVLAVGQTIQHSFTMSGVKDPGSAELTLGLRLVVTPDTSEAGARSVLPVTFFDVSPDK